VLQDYTVEQKESGKGRAFSATCLGAILADGVWSSGATKGDIERPVYAVFAGTDASLRPFAANIQSGRRVLTGSNARRASGFEFLKSAGYKWIYQKEAEGTFATVYLPHLFLIDPGMVDPEEISFIVLPERDRPPPRDVDVRAVVDYAKNLPLVVRVNAPPKYDYRTEPHAPPLSDEVLARLASEAYLFAAYLDRRTRAPIPSDGRFYLQVMLACLDKGLASWSGDGRYYHSQPFGQGRLKFADHLNPCLGFSRGIAFNSQHETLESLLAEEIALYFAVTKGAI
jgi:hypothetical protein